MSLLTGLAGLLLMDPPVLKEYDQETPIHTTCWPGSKDLDCF